MVNLPKKNRLKDQYEHFEADIHKISEDEIKKIKKRVEKMKEEAEKIGEEIEDSMKEKRVKRKKTNTA